MLKGCSVFPLGSSISGFHHFPTKPFQELEEEE